MPNKLSAGIVLYRIHRGCVEVLLVHPGGPLWANRDDGAWSIPKGEVDPAIDDSEVLRREARREFEEETGQSLPLGEWLALSPIRLASGKRVIAWAVEGDMDPTTIRSNHFSMEWPPKSGRNRSFPEVDKAAWMTEARARKKLNAAQLRLLEELTDLLNR